MRPQPTIVSSTDYLSKPAKRTLFRVALAVAIAGTVAVSTILILHGGLALGRLRYFVDVGIHPLHITSAVLLLLGFLALATAILISYGTFKENRALIVLAAVLLSLYSLGLIGFTVWSFVTISSGHLSTSVNNTISKELDRTEFSFMQGNNIVIDNTAKMARLEKQHKCCGLADPFEDYRSRQAMALGSANPSPAASSSSGSANTNRGRTTSTQRNSASSTSAVQLPISCCNENYRSTENLCIDMFGNNTSPTNRYNTRGCYSPVIQHKYDRIQKQGFATTVAACLAVISCIALAAVVRLLGEVSQIVPVRTVAMT